VIGGCEAKEGVWLHDLLGFIAWFFCKKPKLEHLGYLTMFFLTNLCLKTKSLVFDKYKALGICTFLVENTQHTFTNKPRPLINIEPKSLQFLVKEHIYKQKKKEKNI
jgi:hypothetical protein